MDKTIKTRKTERNIKMLDKKTGLAQSVKLGQVKTKEALEDTTGAKPKGEVGTHGYAENKVEGAIEQTVKVSGRAATSGIKRIAAHHRRSRTLAKDAVQKTSQKAVKVNTEATRRATSATSRSIKQAAGASIKSGSRSIKGVSSAVKGTTQVAKAGAGSAKAGAAAAKNAAMATKMSTRLSGMAARATAQSTRMVAKAAVQATRALVRMAIAAAKSLGAVIAAIGGSAAAVIVIICLVALIAVSAFGVFFMGDDMGDGNPTLREVVAEVNNEHVQKIEEIKAANPHDEFSLAGSKTAWKEVLAVFSVKTTTDPDNPLDVVTLDATRQQLLRDVFWTMNSVEGAVEEREVTEIVLEENEDGNQVESQKTTTVKTLVVTQSSKSIDNVAKDYSFSLKQLDLLHQLLDKQYDSAWQSVLYGIRSGSGDIVEIALSQVGNVGGQPFWSWYGFSGRVEWCACYVSWCANEAGYIEAGIIPKFSYCPTGVDWFKSAGLWQDRGYAPQPGDIIFFDWGNDGVSDHVGIVESCDGSRVYAVEGNSGDACQRTSYEINSSSIQGYGTPMY